MKFTEIPPPPLKPGANLQTGQNVDDDICPGL